MLSHFPKYKMCASFQPGDIRRNVSTKFTKPSMETPYWCTTLVHQYDGREIDLVYDDVTRPERKYGSCGHAQIQDGRR